MTTRPQESGPDGGDSSGDATIDVPPSLGGQLVAGWHTNCLIRQNTVRCWGAGDDGQFADGNYQDAHNPVLMTALDSLPGGPDEITTDITAGDSHLCAIRAGDAYCWGHGKYGELGNGDTNPREVPTQVIGLPVGKVTDIEAGEVATCAIADGVAYCWGKNEAGQLGDGTYADNETPQQVLGIVGTPTSITTGQDHACALTDDGSVFCWGHDDGGALGVGQYVGDSTVALPSLMTGADRVSIAGVHTCAVANEAAYCWGQGGTGALGDGNFSDSHTPIPVTGTRRLGDRDIHGDRQQRQ